MKKALIIIGVIVAVLAVLAFVFRDTLSFLALQSAIQPQHSFADDTTHDAPVYSNMEHWAVLPGRDDAADLSLNGVITDNTEAPVDVFFVHPTTYYSPDHWNAALDDQAVNAYTDDPVLRSQASVFNDCCRIYAPRYRQATIAAFFDLEQGIDSTSAIDLAYSDVKKAFNYYLENFNHGRPFILAGHSQGALFIDRILKEQVQGSPLMNQLIAAYPLGFFLDSNNSIPVCDTPNQTGCFVTWNSAGPEFKAFVDSSNNVCVNPLSWKTDDAIAGTEQHQGAVNFETGGQLEKGIVEAQCKKGLLTISRIDSENFPDGLLGKHNYHVYDFAFFYMDIRANVKQRIDAFLNQ